MAGLGCYSGEHCLSLVYRVITAVIACLRGTTCAILGEMSQKNGTRIRGLSKRGGTYHYRWQRNGKRKSISLETGNEAAAIAKVLEIRSRPELVDAGQWEVEVETYVANMLARERWSKATASTKRYILRKAGPEMGIDHPRELTVWRIQKWYDQHRERLTSQESAHHYWSHMRGFCDWLVKHRKLDENLADKVELAKFITKKRDRFLPREEVADLLDAAEKEDPEMLLILLLGFEVGMRRGEISAARPEWLDLKRGTITIPIESEGWRRKNKRPAIIPMVKRVREFFAQHPPLSPYLIRPEKAPGRNRYRFDFKPKYMQFMSHHGHPDMTVHDMRRSFGSNRVSAGVSIEKVANWLAIRPTTAWSHYARFVPIDDDIEKGAA